MLVRNRLLVVLCLGLIVIVRPEAGYSSPTRAGLGSPATTAAAVAPPIPLPHSSGGGLPIGTPSMVGYVYLDAQPRDGAKVTISSEHGIRETTTALQPNNPQPYYTLVLSDSTTLFAKAGETITVTAEYSAHTRTITATVLDNAQQVDVVLPRAHAEDYAFDRQFPQQDQLPASPLGNLAFPTGVVADGHGAIYVVDWGNARVQAFNRAGNRLAPHWGAFGSQPGNLAGPQGIEVDQSGNFYVADTFNYRIQKFTSVGNLLMTWGSQGSGNGQFNAPFGIAIDRDSNVYVSDLLNQRIQKFTSNGQYLAQWGSPGTARGQFNFPGGVAVDSHNNVYVADRENNRIQKFDSTGTYITEWTDGGDNTPLNKPQGIALDNNDNVFVADWGNQRMQKFTSAGVYITGWGNHPGERRQLIGPWGVAVDPSDGDSIYVVDNAAQVVLHYDNNGGFLNPIGLPANGEGPIVAPVGTAIDGNGSIYVTEWDKNRVRIFYPNGTPQATWSKESGNPDWDFDHPTGIAVDSAGNVYVVDTGFQDTLHGRILKFNSAGVLQQTLGGFGFSAGKFVAPTGIAIDQAGDLYVTDYGATFQGLHFGHSVQKIFPDGHVIVWGGYGSGNGQFINPSDVAVDQDGNVYVTDSGNNRIQKFTADGVYITQWVSQGSGDGEIAGPTGIAVDAANNVYVSEGGDLFGTAHFTHYHIQKFSSAGTLITSWGRPGGGDGQFVNPLGVAVDQNGAVYVADSRNNRLQQFSRMSYTQPIATIVSAPGHVNAGQPIRVYGAGSDSDETPAIQSYEWTLSSAAGSTLILTTTAATATFNTSGLAPGRYAISLRVRDTEGEYSDLQTSAVDIGQTDTWTFLLYLNADTSPSGKPEESLARYLSIDSPDGALYRLQHMLGNANVRIAALYDGPGSSDSTYYLSQSAGQFTTVPIPGGSEVNMGDSQTLVNFVTWGQAHAPADHYYLAIADHANGLDGIAWDYTSALNGSAHLTNAKLLQALSAITQNKQRIDVLHLDGCLMGLIETDFQLRDAVHYLITSENLAWSVFAYSDYRAAIRTTTTAEELARAIVDIYAQAVNRQGDPSTIAAIDMDSPHGAAAQMNDVATSVDALSVALYRYVRANPSNPGVLMDLRNTSVQKFDSNGDNSITTDDMYIDLDHWAELMQSLPDAFDAHGQNVASDVRQAAGDLRIALRALVVQEAHSGAGLDNVRGVSIYFPAHGNTRPYTPHDFEFLAHTHWGEFLAAVLDPTLEDPNRDPANPVAPLPFSAARAPELQPRIYFPLQHG